ncbi:uncharacterized protein E0L32_009862 [Thyridium curvatum]|uniref:Thymidylate kinase n=1 Tax=Thyridium curvatum TaxID=1093900 RepID=A0A507AM27_9PEZI|nr:uncharacterized protein E0L32_009862 [Thyridium curvatum]TPX08673.1 hypothetical protein E0L32_009862 [Thyridium curvatum]
MAAVTRQPFAPLDGARLQNLTSLKNRQNAISPSSSVKRKAAESVEVDDSENVDPSVFSKRSKGTDSFSNDLFKPSSLVLTKAAPTYTATSKSSLFSLTTSPKTAPRPRSYLQPKSPAAKLNTNVSKSAPLSAPAGRSPTRGSKRVGILSNNRRRTGSSFGRVDPPAFKLSKAAPFSLDAALKGTIPSYASRSSAAPSSSLDPLNESGAKSDWFFDIHEDTPEQEMTNLLQHSTCVLDISSDEESEQKARRERDEGRDKENVPPADDVSQTSRAASARAAVGTSMDDMVVEKSRDPLSQLNAADFYPEGCDESSVVIIPGDDEGRDEEEQVPEKLAPVADDSYAFAPEVKLADEQEQEQEPTVESLMGAREEPAAKAAVLEPMEGTGESFDLWESGSARDEAEPVAPATPKPVVDEAVAVVEIAA